MTGRMVMRKSLGIQQNHALALARGRSRASFGTEIEKERSASPASGM